MRSRRPARFLAITIAAAAVIGLSTGGEPIRVAHADDFFQSSPGDLSKSHEAQDGSANCNLCHDGGKEVITSKCLGCHDHSNLKSRIDSGKGFHTSALVKGKSCGPCHVEH